MRYLFLSHIYAKDQPAYGGKVELEIKDIKSLSRGDSSNVYEITLQNHWGTHIDTPNHFFENGKRIIDYPADFWFFKNPQAIEVSLKEKELLTLNADLNGISKATELLLFKAGWSEKRGEGSYCMGNPGIHPEVALYLRKNFPNLRAIGIDWISVSSNADRELGRESHKAFLNPYRSNNPVLIIEDMDLSCNLQGLKAVWVLPLRIEGIDSAPCTVVGIFEE